MRGKIVLVISIFVIITAMTGLAAAENGDWYKEGTAIGLPSPSVIPNDGTSFDFDCRFYNYDVFSAAVQPHDMQVWVVPQSAGTYASDITITVCERSFTSPPNCQTGTGSVSLTRYQDLAESETSEEYYIDVSLASTGADNLILIVILRSSAVGSFIYRTNVVDGGITDDIALENQQLSNIPEFPTIALPIAVMLGLMFIITARRRKNI